MTLCHPPDSSPNQRQKYSGKWFLSPTLSLTLSDFPLRGAGGFDSLVIDS